MGKVAYPKNYAYVYNNYSCQNNVILLEAINPFLKHASFKA